MTKARSAASRVQVGEFGKTMRARIVLPTRLAEPVRREQTAVEQHGGHLVRTTGDGILATFDGPGRAIRCAAALGDALRPLGVEIRAALHTGEVEHRGTEIAGIAVHIAARVLDAAAGGELLVSAAVPMLVAGSGFEFENRGERELKGVPGTWQLYAVKP